MQTKKNSHRSKLNLYQRQYYKKNKKRISKLKAKNQKKSEKKGNNGWSRYSIKKMISQLEDDYKRELPDTVWNKKIINLYSSVFTREKYKKSFTPKHTSQRNLTREDMKKNKLVDIMIDGFIQREIKRERMFLHPLHNLVLRIEENIKGDKRSWLR